MKTMQKVLAEHRMSRQDYAYCICGAELSPKEDGGWTTHEVMEAHQADTLSAAGFGLVADAKAPEVRYATLTNGETELDEVVATNATVHLEAMNDNHWWLLVESGGESVHVNFYTKRAKIRGHAETDS